MKGISLWEPWASAIAFDLKTIETRGFRFHYRGPLAICATRTTLHADFIHHEKAAPYFAQVGITKREQLSFGCIVAVCRVQNVIPAEQLIGHISEQEKIFGNYNPGRFGWMLTAIRRLVTPIPFRGSQCIFNVPPSVLEGARFV